MFKLISILLFLPAILFSQQWGYQTPAYVLPDSIGVTNLYVDTLTADSISTRALNVTAQATIDSVRTNVILGNTGTVYVMSQTANNLILGRQNLSSSIAISGTGSNNNISFTNNNINTVTVTPDSAAFMRKIMLVRDIDTSDFGGNEDGTVTSTGQVMRLLCTNLSVPFGTAGLLDVSNTLIRANSVLNITIEYTDGGDITACALAVGFINLANGSVRIQFTPTILASTLTNAIWINLTVY